MEEVVVAGGAVAAAEAEVAAVGAEDPGSAEKEGVEEGVGEEAEVDWMNRERPWRSQYPNPLVEG